MDEPSSRDGASPDRAIPVTGVRQEYDWVLRHCPGFAVVQQSQIWAGDKPLDLLTLRSRDGLERQVYFDISAFFGKGKQPGPPCPYCGEPLRTPRAKQCRKCRRDWHDSHGTGSC